MPQFPNFYETLAESNMRLRQTYLVYDADFYRVLAITNHRSDGVFRVYLEKCGDGESKMSENSSNPPPIHNYGSDDPTLGIELDKWLTKHGKSRVIRKRADSPLFNKFRPFPLGMCNFNGKVYYVERHPNRRSEQGLTHVMLYSRRVSTSESSGGVIGIDMAGPEFRNCVLGLFPTPQECVNNLLDPSVINEAVAFDRNFAFVKGPLDMIFLAHKYQVVGLVKEDLSCVRLGHKFTHLKEVVELLGVFGEIVF